MEYITNMRPANIRLTRHKGPLVYRLNAASKAAQQGALILPIALVILILISIVGLSTMKTSTMEERMSRNDNDYTNALAAANAALDDAKLMLYPGYATNDSQKAPQIMGPYDGNAAFTLDYNGRVGSLTRVNYANSPAGTGFCPYTFGIRSGRAVTGGCSNYTRGPQLLPPKESLPAWLFTTTCTNGYCLPSSPPVSDGILNQPASKRITYGAKTGQAALAKVSQQPYFVIEFLSDSSTITTSYNGTDQIASLANVLPITYAKTTYHSPKTRSQGGVMAHAMEMYSNAPTVTQTCHSYGTPDVTKDCFANLAGKVLMANAAGDSTSVYQFLGSTVLSCWETFGWWNSQTGFQCTHAMSNTYKPAPYGALRWLVTGTGFQQALFDDETELPMQSALYTSSSVSLNKAGKINWNSLKNWEGPLTEQTAWIPGTHTNSQTDPDCSFSNNSFAGDQVRGLPSCSNNGNTWNLPWLYLRTNHEYKSRYRITAVGFGYANAKAVVQQEIEIEVMRWGGTTTTEANSAATNNNQPLESCDVPDVMGDYVDQSKDVLTAPNFPAAGSATAWTMCFSNTNNCEFPDAYNVAPNKYSYGIPYWYLRPATDYLKFWPDNWHGYPYPAGSYLTNDTWGHAKAFLWQGGACSHWLGRRPMIDADPESPGRVNGYDPLKARYVYVRPNKFKPSKVITLL